MASFIQIAEGRSWEGSSASFDLIAEYLHQRLGEIDELHEPLDFARHANCKFMGLSRVSKGTLSRLVKELEHLKGSPGNLVEEWSDEGKQWFSRDLESLISLLKSEIEDEAEKHT